MRVRRPLSAVLGALLVASGLSALVALPAEAAAALGARLFLHGTSANYAQDSMMDPLAWEGFAPTGVTADTTPPTGTASKTGLTFEPTGSPGLPMAPTFATPVTGSLTAACIDVFVEGFEAGDTFPLAVAFGSGPPEAGGTWTYPAVVPVPGTGIQRVTAKLTMDAAFTLPEGSTVFFYLQSEIFAIAPDPTARPYTLYYDSVEHPSNVTLNPTGPCTAASGSAPAPAPTGGASAPPSESASPSAAPSESASAAPSESPSASESASAEPSASAGPNPGSCGNASGDPSASADPSASGDPSASASASASPTGGGGPALPTPGAKTAARTAALAQEPARDATSCRVTKVTLSTNATQITAGNSPLLSGVARDEHGDAVEGATITIYTKGYGENAYTAAATVKTDGAGQYKISIRPTKQTSVGANVGGAKSPVIGIRVSTRVNIAQPTPGNAGTQETFTGNLAPGYARVAVGVAYIRNGRYVVLTQANTDGSGRYAIPARLPRGTYTFVVFTSAHQGTDKGSRSVRLTVR